MGAGANAFVGWQQGHLDEGSCLCPSNLRAPDERPVLDGSRFEPRPGPARPHSPHTHPQYPLLSWPRGRGGTLSPGGCSHRSVAAVGCLDHCPDHFVETIVQIILSPGGVCSGNALLDFRSFSDRVAVSEATVTTQGEALAVDVAECIPMYSELRCHRDTSAE